VSVRWKALLGVAILVTTPLLAPAKEPPTTPAPVAPPPQENAVPEPRHGIDPRPPRSAQGDLPEETPASPSLEELLAALAEKAAVYQSIALRFVCVELNKDSENSNSDKTYDYMYVEEEAQRYRPFRQRHSANPNQTRGEVEVENNFPDAYSWTLMFLGERQHLFKFEFVEDDWFALRRAHVISFTAPLPYYSGQTIYEWGGKVWIDAENLNFLKIEAEPANQEERLKQLLKEYRQAPRFLVFPMHSKPAGGRYSITFLNEYKRLSLPDATEYQEFVLDLEGNAELTGLRSQQYSHYQFFGVELRDRFLK